jgi:hypothetical protein
VADTLLTNIALQKLGLLFKGRGAVAGGEAAVPGSEAALPGSETALPGSEAAKTITLAQSIEEAKANGGSAPQPSRP